MKAQRLFIIILLALTQTLTQTASSQVRTTKLTVYPQFKSSVIQLSNGRTISQPLTNIFLKNSSLLYLKGDQAMEANMENIKSVVFDDRTYIKIDTLLCYKINNVGEDALYCATIIDVPSYQQQLKNNQVISNLDFSFAGSLGGQISTSTIDIGTEEDYNFPLINVYYYLYKGKFVRTHERNLGLILPKEKKRILRTFVTMDDFSWTDEQSLLKLLKALQ